MKKSNLKELGIKSSVDTASRKLTESNMWIESKRVTENKKMKE